jgi:predicted N-acetyltransferase YhbS
MTVRLRRAEAADAAVLGDICYRAFKTIAEAHGFPPDFPSAEAGAGAIGRLIAHPRVFDLVAEDGGRLIGSNFLAERNPISGVGPITVDPAVQNDGAGRALMDAVLLRAQERGVAGVRLV